MGCCHSGEEEAEETALSMPEAGQSINVYVKKQGKRDADYDVIDMSNGEPGEIWMLIDAVGGVFSGGMKYYLKYRKAGEEESTVLGAAEIDDDDTEFSYKIKDIDEYNDDGGIDIGFDSDPDDFSDDEPDEYMEENQRKIKAKWKMSKKCNIYSDKEMTQKLGKLKAKAKGKYKRKTTQTIRTVREVDEEGNENEREETEEDVQHETKLKKFYYKFEVMETKLELKVEKNSEGGSFSKAGLEWTGENELGEELFKIVGDGRNCHIKTSEGSDPSSTLLAAFACAIQLDPKDVEKSVQGMCQSRING